MIIKCIRHLFIHTLSELVGYNDILSLNTYLRNDFTFNDFIFCDRQNIGISKNIYNVFTHYLYQHNNLNKHESLFWYVRANVMSMSHARMPAEFCSLNKEQWDRQ